MWTASMVHTFLIKKLLVQQLKMMSNKVLAEELHKSIIGKFKKVTVHSPFINNIWGADLTDLQLISKFNQGIRYLLCVIDIFSKYA